MIRRCSGDRTLGTSPSSVLRRQSTACLKTLTLDLARSRRGCILPLQVYFRAKREARTGPLPCSSTQRPPPNPIDRKGNIARTSRYRECHKSPAPAGRAPAPSAARGLLGERGSKGEDQCLLYFHTAQSGLLNFPLTPALSRRGRE